MSETKLTAEEQLKAVQTENESLQVQIQEQAGLIAELQGQLEETTKAKASALPVVKHEKVSYQVLLPKFKFAGNDYTVEQLAENKELIKALVEKEVGFLRKL